MEETRKVLEKVSAWLPVRFCAGADVRLLTIITSPAPHVQETRGKHSSCPRPCGLPGAWLCRRLHPQLLHWKQCGESISLCDRLDWDCSGATITYLNDVVSNWGLFPVCVLFQISQSSLVQRSCSPLTPTPAFTQRPALRCLDSADDSANRQPSQCCPACGRTCSSLCCGQRHLSLERLSQTSVTASVSFPFCPLHFEPKSPFSMGP